MYANYECLVFVKRIKAITDQQKRDKLLGYCIRLIFKHHFGEGAKGLDFIEDFVVDASLAYYYSRELNILNFMKQYIKDYTLMEDQSLVGKISVNINNFGNDIDTLFKDI